MMTKTQEDNYEFLKDPDSVMDYCNVLSSYHAVGLSKGDVETINKLYPSSKQTSSPGKDDSLSWKSSSDDSSDKSSGSDSKSNSDDDEPIDWLSL